MNPDLPTYVAGLDPSSAKLTVVGGYTDTDVVDLEACRLVGTDLAEKCVDAFEWLTEFIAEHSTADNNLFIAIEAPVIGRGGPGSTIPQAIVHGALLAAGAAQRVENITVVQSNNQHWKKSIVGRGNANKDDIAIWVRDEHPDFFERVRSYSPRKLERVDQDALDAFCIRLDACKTVSIRQRIDLNKTRVRREYRGTL